jgi:hypothetical protein
MDGTDLQTLGFREEDTLKAQQAAKKDMSGVKNRKQPRPHSKGWFCLAPNTCSLFSLSIFTLLCFFSFFRRGVRVRHAHQGEAQAGHFKAKPLTRNAVCLSPPLLLRVFHDLPFVSRGFANFLVLLCGFVVRWQASGLA